MNTQITPDTTEMPSAGATQPPMTNTTNAVSSILAPEFKQAMNTAFDEIAQSFDIAENKEVFDIVRAIIERHLSNVKPREIRVKDSSSKKRTKKVGYNLYISKRFADNKGTANHGSTTEQMAQYSKEWKALTAEQKKPFEDAADAHNSVGKSSTKKSVDEPSKMSGYNLFMKKYSAEVKKHEQTDANQPKITRSERMQQIGSAWKALGKSAQEAYNQEAEQLNAVAEQVFLQTHTKPTGAVTVQ